LPLIWTIPEKLKLHKRIGFAEVAVVTRRTGYGYFDIIPQSGRDIEYSAEISARDNLGTNRVTLNLLFYHCKTRNRVPTREIFSTSN